MARRPLCHPSSWLGPAGAWEQCDNVAKQVVVFPKLPISAGFESSYKFGIELCHTVTASDAGPDPPAASQMGSERRAWVHPSWTMFWDGETVKMRAACAFVGR